MAGKNKMAVNKHFSKVSSETKVDLKTLNSINQSPEQHVKMKMQTFRIYKKERAQ